MISSDLFRTYYAPDALQIFLILMTRARNHHKEFILQNTVIVIWLLRADTMLFYPSRTKLYQTESLLSKAYNLEWKVTPENKLACGDSDQGRPLGRGLSLAGII